LTEPTGELLVEADLFISYLTGDKFVDKFDVLVESARAGTSNLFASSEVFDDVISALRSQGRTLGEVADFVADMHAIPFESLPVTASLAAKAVELYDSHRGRGKLHYFDSFHVATAIQHGIPLATSDLYIIKNAHALGIEVVNVRHL
jgi:predicted nucleic acid-binding protein